MSTTVRLCAAKGLVKRNGQVTALDGTDFELRAGEILAVIGDNGAGKSSLIKCLSGATIPSAGEICSMECRSTSRRDGRSSARGLRPSTRLAVGAGDDDCRRNLSWAVNCASAGFLGKYLRVLDKKKMLAEEHGPHAGAEGSASAR